jgi:PAS domain S-box-containing protein
MSRRRCEKAANDGREERHGETRESAARCEDDLGSGGHPLMTGQEPSSLEISGPVPLPALTGYSIRRQISWLGAGLILVSGLLVAFTLTYLHGQALESGERLTESFAHVIGEQTERTLEAVNQRLQLAEVGLAQLAATGRLNEVSGHELLSEQVKKTLPVRSILVTDGQGRATFGSDESSLGIDYSDRDYFQIYRTERLTRFYLGAPVLGRTAGTWGLGVSRPLPSADGAFAGVVVAVVEPLHLNEVWSSVELGTGGSVTLFRRDGTLMMRTPFDDAVMGKAFPDLRSLQASPAGTFHSTSPIDGIHRVFSYRTLSTHPDLVVVVGQSYDLVLAPWRQLAATALATWSVASLTILALLRFLNQAWQRGLRADAKIQKLAERLDLATGAAAIGVGDWTKEGPSYASPAYHTMLGYPAEKGSGNPEEWLDRVHPEDRDRVKAAGQASVEEGNDRYQYEVRMRHADGTYRWVSTIGSVVSRDEDGRATRLVEVRIDITGLKQAEERVRRSKDLLQSVVDHVPVRVFWKDRDLRFLGANLLFATDAGVQNPNELAGKTDFEMVWKDQAELYRADDQAVMESGLPRLDHEEPQTTPDGGTIWLSTSKVPLRDEQNRIIGILGIYQDITERRQRERALKALVREKDALLKEVHHRVKNNLALITSLMRLEAGKSKEAETKSALKAMQTRIHSVLLLNETLYKTQHYSRIQLSDYLGGMATHLFRAQNPDPDAVRLVLAFDPVEIDTDQAIPCGLIVNELMTNSLKHAFPFGARGEIRVGLKQESSGEARLSVSDTGVGLPADFEARRGESLGLQLVGDLAKQLQGTLEVGPGPTFIVTFMPRPNRATIEIPPYAAAPK